MKGIVILNTIVLLLVSAVLGDTAQDFNACNEKEQQQQQQQQRVSISSKCAAVLVASATVGMSAATYALAPMALCTAGFCPVGIAGGSFAASWQSTMPLVVSGSLFAQLQSLAMGGAGLTSISLAAGAVGGTAAATYLNDFCQFVDETDPDSVMGKTFAGSQTFLQESNKVKDRVVAACASSETCSAGADAVVATGRLAHSFGKNLVAGMNGFVEGFKESYCLQKEAGEERMLSLEEIETNWKELGFPSEEKAWIIIDVLKRSTDGEERKELLLSLSE